MGSGPGYFRVREAEESETRLYPLVEDWISVRIVPNMNPMHISLHVRIQLVACILHFWEV